MQTAKSTSAINVNDFAYIRRQVNSRIQELSQQDGPLYVVSCTKDELWDTYLNAFPIEERQSNNCNTCRQFIKNCGGVVYINPDLTISTIWDTVTEGCYALAAAAMRDLVLNTPIQDIFLTKERKIGNWHNYTEDLVKWEHFCIELPTRNKHHSANPETHKNDSRTAEQVLRRGLEELSIAATETVLELIGQNSLYRGADHQRSLKQFLELQHKYAALPPAAKAIFTWFNHNIPVARIRNTAIGTLLIDISEGMELDQAVFKYERLMDPVNYKRPRAVYTESTLAKARETLEELGLLGSLQRRYATSADLTVNNVLFVDRAVAADDIFAQLKVEAPINPRTLTKTQDITLEKFISDVLPSATGLEILMESRLQNNLMALVCPVDFDTPTFFKWDNGFTWYYNGAVADSIRERVTKAGGHVQGVLRCSLAWHNIDDLDLHMLTPVGKIYHGNRILGGGTLDVDMNVRNLTTEPVENIIFPTKLKDGDYSIEVHQYTKRNNNDQGFELELEFDGEILTYHHKKNETVTVADFKVVGGKVVSVKNYIEPGVSAATSKKIWGLNTNCFHKVNSITLSPNYWDSATGQGNKHFFFLLDNVTPEGTARPFLNEYIREDLLRDHKRVFEAIGGRLAVEGKPELSGLGFSTTTENHFYCRVQGAFNRVLKVVI